jgi:MFS transporter, DHA1 family, tetracycline resistance protein
MARMGTPSPRRPAHAPVRGSTTAPPRAAGERDLTPIHLATLVCSMGMAGFVAVAGPLAAALGLSAAQLGLSATAGGLGWVLTARAWGRAADRIGRRRVLLVGVAGFAVFYLALAVVAQAGAAWGLAPLVALAGLIGARFAMGVTYSAVPAASNALIADRFAPAARAGAMGRLGAAQAAGLLLGPAFVAAAAGPSPVVPLLLLALLPLPALALLAARLPADQPAAAGAVMPPLPLGERRLRRPVVAGLAAMLAVSIAQIVVGFIALDRLGLTDTAATRLAGAALAAVGFALIAAQIAVARLGWSPGRLMSTGAAIAAVGLFAAALASSPAALVAAYAIAGLGAGWVFPAISAMAANAVGPDEQGRAAGSVSTALALGAMLGPLLGGAVYAMNDAWPLMLAAAIVTIPIAAGVRR